MTTPEFEEMNDLKARVRVLEAQRDEAWRIRLKDLEDDGGGFTMESPIFKGFIGALHEIFIESGATNYLSIDARYKRPCDDAEKDYIIRIQKRAGETPEDQNHRLKAELAALKEQVSGATDREEE